MSKKILVTGGAGFIGSNLCRELLSQGHIIHCFDNFYTGRKENIQEFMDNPRFFFTEVDVTEMSFATQSSLRPPYGLSDFVTSISVDEIYHLACPASPKHYQKSPYYTIQTCLKGTANILELVKRMGSRCKILVASTSEIYGEPLEHPQKESYLGNVSCNGIRSCYDEGKRAMEALICAHFREFGTDGKIVRIFNTYGPNMAENDGRVVSNFITQALKGEDITIYGDGSQTRSFCYVDDLIQGLINVMNNGDIGPYNLGNPEEITVKRLAEIIIDKVTTISKISFKNLPRDDPTRRCPDITKIKSLGWSPKINIHEGLQKTIDYFI